MARFKNILLNNMKLSKQLFSLPEELVNYIIEYIHNDIWCNFVFNIRKELVLMFSKFYIKADQFIFNNAEIDFIAINYKKNYKFIIKNKIESVKIESNRKYSINSTYKSFSESNTRIKQKMSKKEFTKHSIKRNYKTKPKGKNIIREYKESCIEYNYENILYNYYEVDYNDGNQSAQFQGDYDCCWFV